MTGAASAIGGPIVSKKSAQRIVTAPVLVPDEPDRERHWYSQKNIEEVATDFLPGGGGVDAMHLGGDSGYPIESYLAPQELEFGARTVPKGTWIVSMKVTDDEVWNGIERGEFTGVSVQGPIAGVYDDDGNELPLTDVAVPPGTTTGRPPEPALANSLGQEELMLPPAPVGETWRVELAKANFVSIVDDPAVQQATFLVAKRNGAERSDSSGSGETQMDDDIKEQFEKIGAQLEKSTNAAENAEDAATEAKETADEALEAAEGDGDPDGDDNPGGDGGADDDAVADLRADLEDAGVLEDDDGGNDGGLDDDTLDALVEAGVIDEDALDDVDLEDDGGDGDLDPEIEKRLAAIEKSLDGDGGGGRRGRSSLTDDEGESTVSSGRGGVSSAIATGGAGGDDE